MELMACVHACQWAHVCINQKSKEQWPGPVRYLSKPSLCTLGPAFLPWVLRSLETHPVIATTGLWWCCPGLCPLTLVSVTGLLTTLPSLAQFSPISKCKLQLLASQLQLFQPGVQPTLIPIWAQAF